MVRRSRADKKWTTLRRAVIAALCLAVVNVFSVDAFLHAAHGAVGHAYNALDAGHEIADAADHDSHEHADHADDDGSTASHKGCDHAHCCVALVVPTSSSVSLSLASLCRSRPSNQRLAGRRPPPFDRPPNAIL